MKGIILVALLAIASAALAGTADTSAQVDRDGRWLKTQIQVFEKVQAAVADPALPATSGEASKAMFLAGFVVGIVSVEKSNAQLGAEFVARAVEAGRTKRVSPSEAKGVSIGIGVVSPLSNTEFSNEHFSVEQYVQAIKNYLEKHPEKWGLGAAQIIEYTLWEMFPHKNN